MKSAIALLAAIVFAAGLRWGTFAVGGSDSYCYVNQAERWASGRLPRWARDVADTQDLVQETLLQTFKRIDKFEMRGDGALQAYLRQGILNRIRNEYRRAARRPSPEALDSQAQDGAPSGFGQGLEGCVHSTRS